MVLNRFGFDIVHGCQLRCIGCPNSTLRPKIAFTTEATFHACLKNTNVEGVEIFRFFTIGEPMLHPDPAPLVAMLKGWKAKVVEMSTNGQCPIDERLTEVIKTRAITDFVVSCDGDASPAEYERLRPPAKWGKLVEFLRVVRELRDKYVPKMRLHTCTMVGTKTDERKWRDLLRPMGWGSEFRTMRRSPESVFARQSADKKPRTGACAYVRKERLYVDYDGTVVPCCMNPTVANFGNLAFAKYTDIRRGAHRKTFVTTLDQHRETIPVCAECEIT